jgi:DnaJ-class molecular chaperone
MATVRKCGRCAGEGSLPCPPPYAALRVRCGACGGVGVTLVFNKRTGR